MFFLYFISVITVNFNVLKKTIIVKNINFTFIFIIIIMTINLNMIPYTIFIRTINITMFV